MKAPLSLILAFLLLPRPLAAHGTGDGSNLDAMSSAGVIGLGVVLYLWGYVRAPRWRAPPIVCFLLATILLWLALVWPLDAMTDESFAAHMAQHMVLLMVAPPLLIAAAPMTVILRVVPRRLRARAARIAAWPSRGARSGAGLVAAAAVQAAVLTVWHVPWFYDWALRNPFVHIVEHVSLLGSALWFWWLLSRAARGVVPRGTAIAMVFLTLIHSGMLGGLLTFARRPLFAVGPDAEMTRLLAEQQLAGMIMWVPAGFAYILCALWLLHGLLNADEKVLAGSQIR